MLVLDSWKRRWQSIAFDPITGIGRLRWFARRPSRCAGWAVKFQGIWYGIWPEGKNLVFQAGPKKWNMADGGVCTNTRNSAGRVFAILVDGKPKFELQYQITDHESDLMTDDQELEMSDFFYWVSKLWNDPVWQKELAISWGKGKGDENN